MKKNTIIGVVVVLLVLVAGISFAYYLSQVLVSGNGSTVTGDTSDLIKVSYDAGSSSLNVVDMVPGDVASKEFDITITPTNKEKEATYVIKLNINNNTFVECDDSNYNSLTNACERGADELVYRLKDNDNQVIAEGTLMGVTGEIKLAIETKEVEVETNYHYTLEIEFVETNADQNHNANKTLNSNITVEFSGKLLREEILANNELHTETPDFTKTAQASCSDVTTCEETNGLYQAEDDYGTTYYFRGAVDNNWVSFAGYYWRIIRINGDGSIRMIYSGEDTGNVTEANRTGEGTQIGTSAFNTQYDDNAYFGYMYGTPGSDTYEETHANINDSTIKTVLDNWYQQNLLSYADYISKDGGFCNDRSLQNGTGIKIENTLYSAYNRVLNGNVTLKCQSIQDLFTRMDAKKGNNKLIYSIGLITADELVYSGINNLNENKGHYLYNNLYFWTMTPGYLSSEDSYIFAIYNYTPLGAFKNDENWSLPGVRPVINLDKNVTISSGDGTSSNPYVVV